MHTTVSYALVVGHENAYLHRSARSSIRSWTTCLQSACPPAPSLQVVGLAKAAGFTNVHDYLVHIVTGEYGGVATGGSILKSDQTRSLTLNGLQRTCDADAATQHDILLYHSFT